jgi:hypothetical protein
MASHATATVQKAPRVPIIGRNSAKRASSPAVALRRLRIPLPVEDAAVTILAATCRLTESLNAELAIMRTPTCYGLAR